MKTLLELFNETDRFAAVSGCRLVEVRQGYARAEMTVGESHLNGGGVCQGGALFTLADLAIAAVMNSHGLLTLGIQNSIHFFKSGMLGDVITAEATEVYDHHKLPFCEVKIYNQHHELLCTADGAACRKSAKVEFEGLM